MSYSSIDGTWNRGDRRRDNADPGDRNACLPPSWIAFSECQLVRSCLIWSSFFSAGDSSLLSVETEETGAEMEIVEECWWRGVNWGRTPVES